MPVSREQPAPQRQTVLSFASPSVADILFYDTVDAERFARADTPEYGTAHPDKVKWPNHKLVFIENYNNSGLLYKFYYAADRSSQEDYNFELSEDVLTRTYVLPRATYLTDLPVPDGGEPDTVFTSYGFTGDEVRALPEPLNGFYVAVVRKFELITVTEYPYDETLERNISVTKTLKPAGYVLSDDSLVSGNGTLYEVKHGNIYHSLLYTTESGLGGPDNPFPVALPVVYSTQNTFPFPPKLTAYEIIYESALVLETLPEPGEATRMSFDEDMLPTYTLIAPKRGPFKTKISRFITDDPESVIDTILAGATLLPLTKRETIVSAYSMAYLPAYYTKAFAREFPVPESYHTAITITNTQPAEGDAPVLRNLTPEILPATDGFTGDFVGDYLIDVTSKQVTSDLYEVTSVELVLNNIYS